MVNDEDDLVEALRIMNRFCSMTDPELVNYIEELKITIRQQATVILLLEARLKEHDDANNNDPGSL